MLGRSARNKKLQLIMSLPAGETKTRSGLNKRKKEQTAEAWPLVVSCRRPGTGGGGAKINQWICWHCGR